MDEIIQQQAAELFLKLKVECKQWILDVLEGSSVKIEPVQRVFEGKTSGVVAKNVYCDGIRTEADFDAALTDGRILCHLLNALMGRVVIPNIHDHGAMKYLKMENISSFTMYCEREFGIPMFQPVDLYEGRFYPRIYKSLSALSEKSVSLPDYVEWKEAEGSQLCFSKNQIVKARKELEEAAERERMALQKVPDEYLTPRSGDVQGGVSTFEGLMEAEALKKEEEKKERLEVERKLREEQLREEGEKKEILRKQEEAEKKEALRKQEEERKKEIIRKQDEAEKKEVLRKQEEAEKKEALRKQEEERKKEALQKEEERQKETLRKQEEERRQLEIKRREELSRREEEQRRAEANEERKQLELERVAAEEKAQRLLEEARKHESEVKAAAAQAEVAQRALQVLDKRRMQDESKEIENVRQRAASLRQATEEKMRIWAEKRKAFLEEQEELKATALEERRKAAAQRRKEMVERLAQAQKEGKQRWEGVLLKREQEEEELRQRLLAKDEEEEVREAERDKREMEKAQQEARELNAAGDTEKKQYARLTEQDQEKAVEWLRFGAEEVVKNRDMQIKLRADGRATLRGKRAERRDQLQSTRARYHLALPPLGPPDAQANDDGVWECVLQLIRPPRADSSTAVMYNTLLSVRKNKGVHEV